jgi:hypothetical protein
MEGDTPLATLVAQAAIVLFLLLLLLVVARTIVLFSGLLIMPVSRLLRRVPGIRKLVQRLERNRGFEG